MNLLEELHIRIDKENWDVKQEDLFNKAFKELNRKLAESNQNDLLRKSEVERQVFAFSKEPENGLAFKIAGKKKLEDGTEVPFEWPDIKEWTEEDFIHIHSRFDNCKNLFATPNTVCFFTIPITLYTTRMQQSCYKHFSI